MKYLGITFTCVSIVLSSCSPKNSRPLASVAPAPHDLATQAPLAVSGSQAGEGVPLVGSVFEQKIDATKLRVWDIVISNQRVATSTSKQVIASASFEFDGKAETLEYQICPLEGAASNQECVSGTTVYYRLRLYGMFAGKVLLKARACVDARRALSADNCGPWEEKVYESPFFDQRLAGIDQEIVKATRDLRNLGIDYHQALADFVTEANACVINNSEVEAILRSKTRVVEQFLHTPVAWFAQSAENLATLALGEEVATRSAATVSRFGGEVADRINDACVNLGRASKDAACTYLKAVITTLAGFLTALNPVSAISTLSVSIHNVYYGTLKGEGDKLVAMNCLAEQKLQNTVPLIQKQMEDKVQKIRLLKQQRDQ